MNRNSSGNENDWPMVPIFGRRKRPRQAFYASPSQDSCKGEHSLQKQLNIANQSNQSYQCNQNNQGNQSGCKQQLSAVQIEYDISLADLDNDYEFQKDGDHMGSNSSEFGGETLLQRNTIYQRLPMQQRQQIQKIPLQKHPRNNFKAEANVKFRKENKENTDLKVHEVERKEIVTTLNKTKLNDQTAQKHRRSTVPRMLTLATRDINGILGYKEMIFALYEVYGILDSPVTSVPGHCAKRFMLRDGEGSIRCVFWEIDRPFPQIRRGASIRCVGRIVDGVYQCLSIRATNQVEMKYAKSFQSQSREAIQNYIITCREC